MAQVNLLYAWEITENGEIYHSFDTLPKGVNAGSAGEALVASLEASEGSEINWDSMYIDISDDLVDTPLQDLLFERAHKAREEIRQYGERSAIGEQAAQTWRVLEALIREANLLTEFAGFEAGATGCNRDQ